MSNGPLSAVRMRYSRLRPERLAALREQEAQDQERDERHAQQQEGRRPGRHEQR
jgi:hypothetical protein